MPMTEATLRHPIPLTLVDCTLREGDQTPGVWLRLQDKLSLLSALGSLGLTLFDAGMPEVGAEEQTFFREAMALSAGRWTIGASIRLSLDAARLSIEAGCDALFVICPVSPLHREQRLGLSLMALKQRMQEVFRAIRRTGKRLFMVAEDAARCPLNELSELFALAQDEQVEIAFVCDTVGIYTPHRMDTLIRFLRQEFPELPLGVHCHNDFGMATANTIAAIEAGVDFPTVCINGLGERSGNASLAEVMLAAEQLLGRQTGLDAGQLLSIARHVEHLTGTIMSPLQPIVGANAFRHESGIHVDGILKNASTYEPIEPERVNRYRELSFGKHTGRAVLRHLAERAGIRLTEMQLAHALERLHLRGSEHARTRFASIRADLSAWESVGQGISEGVVIAILKEAQELACSP